jgi:hypothetical protein
MPDKPTSPPQTPPAKPDALLIPESFRVGKTTLDRVDSVCTLAEGILGGDRAGGVTAYVRRQPAGRKMFVTLDPMDQLHFEKGSGNRGSRYTWKPQENGIEYGYLVDAAKEKPGA